jgi:hypothetical protein
MIRSNRLWLAAFLLGWIFDFLFWKQTPGISFFIFVMLCVAGVMFVLINAGLKPDLKALILLAPIVFFAAMSFIRIEEMTSFINVVFTLLSLSILTMTYLGGRWLSYSAADYVRGWFEIAASVIIRPIAHSLEARKDQSDTGAGSKIPWAIMRGILFAIPVIAIFAALLSEADLIFAQRLEAITDLLRLENLPEYIFRFVYICVIGYALAGVTLHASAKSKDENLLGIEKPIVPAFFGFTEASIILGSVIALFTLFVTIQFQYFFGGQTNINLEGYTYSEYARRGFGELVTVAFFSLLLFLGISTIVKRENEAQHKVFSGLGAALIALVMIMLYSALQRLWLYEAAYGFSRLRTYTHVFIIWLALLLIAAAALDFMRKQRAFALAMLIALIGFGASLNILNVDGFIVRENVERAVIGFELDSAYLATLSADAIPALADAYADPKLSADFKDRIGAALVCQAHRDRDRSDAFQSFHFSAWKADQTFLQLDKELKQYTYSAAEWTPKVTTPLGEVYECYTYID